MKNWYRISICTAIVFLVSWHADIAFGADVSGRTSTVVEWFDDSQEDTAIPVYQYLRLYIKNIREEGWNFKGYGRLSEDVKNEVDADSRLYYGYLEKKEITDDLDFKLGRQFITTTAGASIMDGINLKYYDLGSFNVQFFGGGDVPYYEGYNVEDLIVGGEVSRQWFDENRLDIGVSYLEKWNDGDLSQELFGLDVDYDYEDRINFYSETQFNYLANSVSYFLGGLHYFEKSKWSLRGEYLYSLPVFSSTSIYSVFAVSEYEEAMTEFNYYIRRGLRAFTRYSFEMYDAIDDAHVFEGGLEKIRTEHFSGYFTGIFRDGGGSQDLMGFKTRAAYLFDDDIEAGVGVHLDVLERRLDDNEDDSTSARYWFDLTAYINDDFNIQAKVESIESKLWDKYYRGRVSFNILF